MSKWNNFCKIHNKINEEKSIIEQNANNSFKITLKTKLENLESTKKSLVEKHSKIQDFLKEEDDLKDSLKKINSLKKEFFNQLNEQNVRLNFCFIESNCNFQERKGSED